MGKHEGDAATITNPRLYPEQLQIKLYQAFIFSIPILFSIILFLLFYLFYLKRRAANNVASQNPRMQLFATSSRHHSAWNTNVGIKGELKEKLQVIQFDEKVKARDSLCCVCLGEFEMEEELRQVRLCRHVFHGDCIHQWLRANASCPLCRCPLLTPPLNSLHLIPANTTIHQVLQINQQDRGGQTQSSSDGSVEHVIQISEEPSSSNTSSGGCL